MQNTLTEPELHELVSLITCNDPSLAKLKLPADGTFQKRDISCEAAASDVVDCLRSLFERVDPHRLPHLYYACGRARCGSTSLTNVFGMAGLPSYYQPVKAALRHVVHDTNAEAWDLGAVDGHAFAKETFGPYTVAECLFQPLDILIAAGYPADKIDLILVDREPMSALASWLANWSHRVPHEQLVFHFVLAGLNVQRVINSAKSHGIRTTTYVYELSKDPVFAVGRLFDRLGISSLFSVEAVTDWHDSGDLGSDRSSIIFPNEPPIYDVPGLHGSDVAYRFHARTARTIPAAYTSLLTGLNEVARYRDSIQSCINDLEIDPTRAEAIFG